MKFMVVFAVGFAVCCGGWVVSCWRDAAAETEFDMKLLSFAVGLLMALGFVFCVFLTYLLLRYAPWGLPQ